MPAVRATTAVAAAANVLREEILTRPDGARLGSEDDLLAQLDVSRPTLRQAARLLEAEELLVVRRGLNGGLFARRPTSDVVARMASVYLRSEGTTVLDLARSWFLLLEHSARLAAMQAGLPGRRRFAEEVKVLAARKAGSPPEDQFAVTQDIAVRMTRLAGSTTLALFADVLIALIRDAPADVRGIRAPGGLGGKGHLDEVASAIEAGDAEKAAFAVRRHAEIMLGWLAELMPDRRL
jgi:DNA-binding FadR family transcriptional regulator